MTAPFGYEFGDVRVDLRRMIVTVGGQPVALEPKSFDVLRYLVEHPDRLVGKDELLDGVWGGDTFVTPNVLTRAVSQLRRAIGDEVHNARYIETVAKRGYRFVAPLRVLNDAGEGAPVEAAVVPPPLGAAVPPIAPPSRRRWTRFAAAAAALLALAAGAGWWIAQPRAPSAARPLFWSAPEMVTARRGLNIGPTLSPDGRLVAYASDRSGSLEISLTGLAPGAREIAITADGGQNSQPAFSPDGQWLAFHSRKRGGVFIVPATGGPAQQVVEQGSHPSWSPDGQRLVFTSDEGTMAVQSTLWTVRRDGQDRRMLTRLGEPAGGHRHPTWSHDGRHIVFTVLLPGGRPEIWAVEASGGAPRPLRQGPGAGFDPQLADDGRALYFASMTGAETRTRIWRQPLEPDRLTPLGEPAEIAALEGLLDGLALARDGTLALGASTTDINLWAFEIQPDGTSTEPVRLTDDVVRNGRPDYSPDGRIAFMQHGRGRPFTTWLMNDDGTQREPVFADVSTGNPQWSRDGRLLVNRDTPVRFSLWWVDLPTRRLTLAPVDAVETPIARLSPDARQLAYHVVESNGVMNVWTRGLDGTPGRRLTEDAEAMAYPAWSPDGRSLAVQIKRGSDNHIGVMSAAGGPVEQLTFDHGQSWPNSWAPDGDRIAFAGERDGVWNIWSVSRRSRTSTRLTRFTSSSGYVRYPAWSPRGNRIVFERSLSAGSVWMVRPR